MAERESGQVQTRQISRAEVRSAVVKGLRLVKDGPASVKLTEGQKTGITQGRSSH